MSPRVLEIKVASSGEAVALVQEANAAKRLGRFLPGLVPAALTVLLFVATRWWLLAVFQPVECDITHYRESARHGIDCGQVPYRDFVMEYRGRALSPTGPV